MKISTYKYITWVSFLYILYLLRPFPVWFINDLYLNIIFIGSLLTLPFLDINKKYIYLSARTFVLQCSFSLMILYLFSPLISHDFQLARIMVLLPLLIIFMLRDHVIINIYKKLHYTFVLVSAIATGVFLMNVLGPGLPYLSIEGAFRANTQDYYRLYGIVLELYRGDAPISGGGIPRISGMFAEPGHYGIYLILILFAEKLNIRDWRNQILIIAGLLTFSTAFYGFLILLLLYYFFQSDFEIKYKIGSIFIIIFIILFFISDNYYAQQARYLTFERAIPDNSASITEIRTSHQFMIRYNSLDNSDKILGVGPVKSSDIETPSNFRTLIFTYGYIGFSLIIIVCSIIASNLRKKDAVIFLLIVLGILFHRYWFFTVVPLYGLLFITSKSVNNMK